MYRTIDTLIENTTRKYRTRPAYSLKSGFRTKTYTYAHIYNLIRRYPGFFQAHGIAKGDKIIVLSLNRPEYATLIFGAIWSGVILVPIDYRTNKETINKFIAKTKPKAIVTSTIFKGLFESSDLPTFFFEDIANLLNMHEVKPYVPMDPDATSAILFTSGTTGEPKGTIISYKNMIASLNNARDTFPLPTGLRILSVLPLSHALEMFGGMMTAYSFGCHIHYIERINSIMITQALKRYRIQAMAVVPQMLRLILQNIEHRVVEEKKQDRWEKAHRIAPKLPMLVRRRLFKTIHAELGGHFRFFVCGSAPLEKKLAQLWKNMGVSIYEGYGASETTGFVATNTMQQNTLGTVGRLLPRMDYKLAEGGELWVKGDNVVKGYYENDEQTKEAFVDGWFRTGDIIQFDNKGNITISGRDKFKIVLPDGKKVYPEDIEKKLNNHPLVIDSTVFGFKTDEGEIVHAELILKQPSKAKHVIDQTNTLLNSHEQILDFGIFPEKDFPRTKTLKVDREAVRQMIQSVKKPGSDTAKKEHVAEDTLTKILRLVSGKETINLHGNSVLATDLKLDSLKRVELLALIEEELGVTVSEVAITPHTTIADLRKLISHGKPAVLGDGIVLPRTQFTPFMDTIRIGLQNFITIPLMRSVIRLQVRHKDPINLIRTPQLFIFNHVGSYDVFNDLSVLPSHVRRKIAIGATREIWVRNPTWQGWMLSHFVNMFPIIKVEEGNNAMRGNFERIGEILDKGYNVFLSPEGNITSNGELLPFHSGAGYIAVEMEVPVTIFKLNGYFELWPADKKRKLNLIWPKKRGTAEVIISEPITFSKNMSYEEATRILREKMLSLE